MKLLHDRFIILRCCYQSVYLCHTTIFLLLASAAMSSSQASAAGSTAYNSPDRTTLLTFKSMISDPFNALSSWADNTTIHFCQWRGITCGSRHPDRVTSLNLDSLGLAAASLPPHIANLTFLTTLSLPNNSFRGNIPYELGGLRRLSHLNLSSNYLNGEIPASLTRCTNLQSLSLRSNALSGEIPRDIGSLSQLLVLSLSNNILTGTIPPSLGNITSLVNLLLQENKLAGSIPDSLGKLSSVQHFYVNDNRLSGNIPLSLYNLSSLQYLLLERNLLTGTLSPNMFDHLPNFQSLRVSANNLHGPIPSSLSNASMLQDLEMVDNNFSGTIPASLGNLPYLYFLNLGNNQLEAKEASDWDFLTSLANCSSLEILVLEFNSLGSILPPSITDLSPTLRHLLFGGNQISGSIPDGISNLTNLTILGFHDNLLSGSIPATIGKLQQLHVLGLYGNFFTGQIPRSIGNLTQLNILYLQVNSLNGSIPASLSNCQRLEELNLSQNMLTGAIPKELVMISLLSTYLDISYNQLTGPLPPEVGKLTNLNGLDISYNKLAGVIPTTLSDCQSLEYLYMQHNFFSGAIPQSLSELKGLLVLDLSQNSLSGDFPGYLGSLGGLQYLNLSYNKLEGEVPDEGILRNATAVSVLGNKNLCGGSPNLHLPGCPIQYPKKQKHKSIVLRVLVPVVGAFLCLAIFLAIYVARYRLRNPQKNSPFTSSIEGPFKQISYAELLKATDGFSPSNMIGFGRVGSVYRGILNMDENICVAVKVLNLQRRGATESFMAECDVLRSIRHRNLVKILTACSTVDFSGNDFKALVLEFMPNGNLERWLHPVAPEHSESITLSLDERLNIAIDVASALQYLHHDGHIPIIHCDLKPSNILLDANMCAHVGDFGLARFIRESIPQPDKYQTTSTGIKGTIGYVAPEYGMGSQASRYGDVYSYGILLLELFTGKRPTNEMFTDDLSLHSYAEMAFPERVLDIVDSRLDVFDSDKQTQERDHNENDARVAENKCLVLVIGVGLSCSKQDPRERMKMEDIIKELQAVRDMLLTFKIK